MNGVKDVLKLLGYDVQKELLGAACIDASVYKIRSFHLDTHLYDLNHFNGIIVFHLQYLLHLQIFVRNEIRIPRVSLVVLHTIVFTR